MVVGAVVHCPPHQHALVMSILRNAWLAACRCQAIASGKNSIAWRLLMSLTDLGKRRHFCCYDQEHSKADLLLLGAYVPHGCAPP